MHSGWYSRIPCFHNAHASRISLSSMHPSGNVRMQGERGLFTCSDLPMGCASSDNASRDASTSQITHLVLLTSAAMRSFRSRRVREPEDICTIHPRNLTGTSSAVVAPRLLDALFLATRRIARMINRSLSADRCTYFTVSALVVARNPRQVELLESVVISGCFTRFVSPKRLTSNELNVVYASTL